MGAARTHLPVLQVLLLCAGIAFARPAAAGSISGALKSGGDAVLSCEKTRVEAELEAARLERLSAGLAAIRDAHANQDLSGLRRMSGPGKGALVGALAGAALSAAVSVPIFNFCTGNESEDQGCAGRVGAAVVVPFLTAAVPIGLGALIGAQGATASKGNVRRQSRRELRQQERAAAKSTRRLGRLQQRLATCTQQKQADAQPAQRKDVDDAPPPGSEPAEALESVVDTSAEAADTSGEAAGETGADPREPTPDGAGSATQAPPQQPVEAEEPIQRQPAAP